MACRDVPAYQWQVKIGVAPYQRHVEIGVAQYQRHIEWVEEEGARVRQTEAACVKCLTCGLDPSHSHHPAPLQKHPWQQHTLAYTLMVVIIV